MIYLRQSTTSQEILLGRFLDSTDGNTEETGLTIANTDIKIWKNGTSTIVDKTSGGATHISNGLYYCVFDATDTDTLGSMHVMTHITGALATKQECVVLSANVYDAWIAGTDNLQVDAVQIEGVDATDQITTSCTSSLNTYDPPTNAEMEARTIPTANYFDPAVDAVANVTLVGTTTTNTDMRGTNIGDLNDISPAEVNAEVDTALADYDGPTNTEMETAFTEIKGATYAEATDSLEAIRDRGDAAWTTGAGGSSPTVEQIRTEMDDNSTQLAAIVEDTGTTLPAQISANTLPTAEYGTGANQTDIEAKIDIIDTNVDAILVDTDVTIPGLINGLNDISTVEVNTEMVDALNVDPYAEPGQGAPPATNSIVSKLSYLYKKFRNRETTTEDTYSLYNDDGITVDQQATVADDNTTATKGEIISGA